MGLQVEQFLKDFHSKHPSCSSNAFAFGSTKDGLNSYQLLIETLKNKKGDLLDLACGDGFLLDLFAGHRKTAETLYGIDMSVGELNVAWSLESLRRPQILQGNARALPFASETFEAVTCHMAFMLMPQVHEIIAEIHRVLQPGGIFAAIIPGKRSQDPVVLRYREWVQKNVPMEKLDSLKELGDERVGSEESLRTLFKDFREFSLEPVEISYTLTPAQTAESYSTMYASGFLNDQQRQKLISDLTVIYKEIHPEKITHVSEYQRLVVQK